MRPAAAFLTLRIAAGLARLPIWGSPCGTNARRPARLATCGAAIGSFRNPSNDLPAHMRPEHHFQDLILTLQHFWAKQGCLILQPYDVEIGAGTFHPATTLRALGPRPWNAAYVQPLAPPEGRPLRREPEPAAALLPVPGDPEAGARTSRTCISSRLRAIGIDPKLHDIRFVEDDWEIARRSAPGGSAGRSGATGWRSPSSPTSSSAAASIAIR